MICTLAAVVVWILMSVVSGFSSQDAELDYQEYLDPIQATFNEDALKEIQRREEEKLLIDRDALE